LAVLAAVLISLLAGLEAARGGFLARHFTGDDDGDGSGGADTAVGRGGREAGGAAPMDPFQSGRELLAASLLADMAAPLILPVVDMALQPVQTILLEWIVEPISYQIKRSYDVEFDAQERLNELQEEQQLQLQQQQLQPQLEDSRSGAIGGVEEGGSGERDFWGHLGKSIQSIFIIGGDEDSDEAVGPPVPVESLGVAKSNEGLWTGPSEVEGSGGDRRAGGGARGRAKEPRARAVRSVTVSEAATEDDTEGEIVVQGPGMKRVVLDRVASRTVERLSAFAQSVAKSLSKTATEAVPLNLSVLKCGKADLSAYLGGRPGSPAAADAQIVSGSEASLVMKLEGFTPSSAVILFGSQSLAGEFGLPAPVVGSDDIFEALQSLDESKPGKFLGESCDSVRLGIGGLVETLEMSLNTPNKILAIVNHTDKKGTTFVQRMRFTERYCTGKLYFQALDTKACTLSQVVNATLPDSF